MNCKTQKAYNGKVSVIITAFGEHYGKILGSADPTTASKVRSKLKANKITISEAIAFLKVQ